MAELEAEEEELLDEELDNLSLDDEELLNMEDGKITENGEDGEIEENAPRQK